MNDFLDRRRPDPAGPTVNGYCPMGCGQTLVLDPDAQVCCGRGDDCPSQYAAATILEDPETDHVVSVTNAGFCIRHPLRERIGDALLDCELFTELTDSAAEPLAPGRYRVGRPLGNDLWFFVPIDVPTGGKS